MGIERRQTPVLPDRIENVGRRADMRARYDEIPACPCLRACTVSADSEVAVDADRHAFGASDPCCFGQLLVGDPLRPGEKIDPIPMLLCEPCNGGGDGVLIFLGPVPPIRLRRCLRGKMLAQRLEAAEAFERVTLLAPEVLECLASATVGIVPKRLE